jgi:hypothetical protein
MESFAEVKGYISHAILLASDANHAARGKRADFGSLARRGNERAQSRQDRREQIEARAFLAQGRQSHKRLADWTDGCIAVTDTEIDEIWRLVDVGTPIQINP